MSTIRELTAQIVASRANNFDSVPPLAPRSRRISLEAFTTRYNADTSLIMLEPWERYGLNTILLIFLVFLVRWTIASWQYVAGWAQEARIHGIEF